MLSDFFLKLLFADHIGSVGFCHLSSLPQLSILGQCSLSDHRRTFVFDFHIGACPQKAGTVVIAHSFTTRRTNTHNVETSGQRLSDGDEIFARRHPNNNEYLRKHGDRRNGERQFPGHRSRAE
jgi:hypothetical protein